jgi:hypothetical protein
MFVVISRRRILRGHSNRLLYSRAFAVWHTHGRTRHRHGQGYLLRAPGVAATRRRLRQAQWSRDPDLRGGGAPKACPATRAAQGRAVFAVVRGATLADHRGAGERRDRDAAPRGREVGVHDERAGLAHQQVGRGAMRVWGDERAGWRWCLCV